MVKQLVCDQYNWVVMAGGLILTAGFIQLLDSSVSLALPVLGVGAVAVILGLTKRGGRSDRETG